GRGGSEAEGALLDVLPVGGVKTPCHYEEQSEEQQHPNAQLLAEKLVGLSHPTQTVGDVCDVIVELGRLTLVGRREDDLAGGRTVVILEDFGRDLRETVFVVVGHRALPYLLTILVYL